MKSLETMLREGLAAPQKRVPSPLLYDALGSVLFEAITLLPEYGVTRADNRMLQASAREALAAVPGPLELIELGPGHGNKAQLIVRQVLKLQPKVRFIGVDVSAGALEGCRKALSVPGVEFVGVEARFRDALKALPPRPAGHRRVVCFLGSNLSNFDRAESQDFLVRVRAALEPGDALLLTADLDKPKERLLPAYDDALGVTAAFNKNVLVHLNRDWGANFDLTAFVHDARWNAEARRIEMHLRATRPVVARIAKFDLEVKLAPGETLWTESSHRFEVAELEEWGKAAALPLERVSVDTEWPLMVGLFVAR